MVLAKECSENSEICFWYLQEWSNERFKIISNISAMCTIVKDDQDREFAVTWTFLLRGQTEDNWRTNAVEAIYRNKNFPNKRYKCKTENQVEMSKKFSQNQPFDGRGSEKTCSTATTRCSSSWPRGRRSTTWSCRTMWAFHEDSNWLILIHHQHVLDLILIFSVCVFKADVILMKAELYFVSGVRPGHQKLTFLVSWFSKWDI